MIIYMVFAIKRLHKQITNTDHEFKESINIKKNKLFKKDDKLDKSDTLDLHKIVGLESVKNELRYYLDFIKYRDKYKNWNVKLPKGILLIGPPGTGKTLLVKTLAKEIELPVIHASGSEFVEMYVGLGASRVRKLFSKARNYKEGCIVFIDEIDAIGKKREMHSNNSERDNTLNQLLVEIDGFGDKDNVIVFGATNLVKNLDSALTRSGRFDKKVFFDPPNKEERIKLFELYLEQIDDDISVEKLAELTSGLNGADIANICNQSKINTIQQFIKIEEDKEPLEIIKKVNMENIQKAIDEVMIGREKPERKMELEERERVAYHEAGHALMSFMLKGSNPPIKVSIMPRGENALGFSQSKPTDKKLYTQNAILSDLCVLLGGRVAEKVIYGNYSSGAMDDIEKATIISKHWFLHWGMDNNSGPLNYRELNNQISYKMINKMKKFIKDIEDFTFNNLSENKEYIIQLGKMLLDKETIIYSDIIDLLPKELENKIELPEI